MKISVTKGHLTPTEKSHIRALFDAGLMEGKVNRKTYYIISLEATNHFKVDVLENSSDDWGRKKLNVNKVNIKIVK